MTQPDTEQLVVIATPTIGSGYVVRWYRNEAAAQYAAPLMSVSRDGVQIETFVHLVPADALNKANELHRLLCNPRTYETGCDAARDAATHRLSFLGRKLTPIVRQEADADA